VPSEHRGTTEWCRTIGCPTNSIRSGRLTVPNRERFGPERYWRLLPVLYPTIRIARHFGPITLVKVGRPGRCVVGRTKAGRCVEEPQGAQDVALSQRLFVGHCRIQIIVNKPLDGPLFGATAARIRQCSTRDRNAVDIEENGTSTGCSCIRSHGRHRDRHWRWRRTTSRSTDSRHHRRNQHDQDQDHDATTLSLRRLFARGVFATLVVTLVRSAVVVLVLFIVIVVLQPISHTSVTHVIGATAHASNSPAERKAH
jgi:hypothetical protein